MTLLPIFLISYLIGSIPFGLILVKLAGKGDIRKIGSGNIGATNVLRTGSKKLAALTLLLDGGKGFFAVWLIQNIMQRPTTDNDTYIFYGSLLILVSITVLIGHIFPIWLKFKGGKGVATALGIYLAIDWQIGLITCGVWLFVALVFRYSSLAAIVAVIAAFLVSIIQTSLAFWPMPFSNASSNVLRIVTMVIALTVIARHHANIRRLLNGTEPKIGKSKAEVSSATP